jgi:hypothetical protein
MTICIAFGLTGTIATVAISTAAPALADSASEVIGAVNWAEAQMGSTTWDGKCLTFVVAAYSSGGEIDINPDGEATPVDYWNHYPSAQHTDTNPPEGALVFWGATPYGSITDNNPDGHVALSIGGGEVISSSERTYTGIHEFTVASRNADGYPYLGWMMPPGVSEPSGGSTSATLWGINTSGQAMRYAGNAQWTYQGGPAFKDIAADSDGSTVAAVSTTGAVYTYAGSGAWHMVSGATLTDVADQAGTLWGINTSGQAMRYAGNGQWTYQGGPAFKDIAANESTVAAVSTTGAVYTYTGGGTWHVVSGTALNDVAVQ